MHDKREKLKDDACLSFRIKEKTMIVYLVLLLLGRARAGQTTNSSGLLPAHTSPAGFALHTTPAGFTPTQATLAPDLEVTEDHFKDFGVKLGFSPSPIVSVKAWSLSSFRNNSKVEEKDGEDTTPAGAEEDEEQLASGSTEVQVKRSSAEAYSDYFSGYDPALEGRDYGYGAPEADSYGVSEPTGYEVPSYGGASSGGYGGGGGPSGGYGGGGGYSGGGGYGDPGYKVQPKLPGPYGPPTPNFKCEKASETLYVTETKYAYDKQCFTIYKVECTEGYDTGKDIGYQKHCNEFTETRCRTVYDTSSEERCWTTYKKQCDMVYETKVDWEYEQKCTTSYEEECHGYGYHQDCEKVPKEHCKQVPKKVEKQVPRTQCKKVPDKRCQDFPINVPRKECKEFPKTVCTQDPINVAKNIPKKTCVQVPKEICNKIPRTVVEEVPKKVGKKVCTSTKPYSSYGEPSYGGPAAPSYSPPSSYPAADTYSPPSSSYEDSSYSAPAPSYTAPAPSYTAPAPSYTAPAPSYVAPSTSYGAPSYSFKRSPSVPGYAFAQVAPSDHLGVGGGR